MSELLKIGLGGLLSFSGALLAVVVGHWLTSQRKRRDELYELRLKAYTDFITAASHLATARRTGATATELAHLASMNDVLATCQKACSENIFMRMRPDHRAFRRTSHTVRAGLTLMFFRLCNRAKNP